jgi:hypothetical protein
MPKRKAIGRVKGSPRRREEESDGRGEEKGDGEVGVEGEQDARRTISR